MGSIHLGRGCQIEHGFEFDGWLGIRAFAHQSWPHRVVDCRVFVDAHDFFRSGSASGLPGPKCFKMTNGSLVLWFCTSTPACAVEAVTNSSSSVISPNRIMEGVETGCIPKRPWPCVRMRPYAALSRMVTLRPGRTVSSLAE